MSIEKITEDIKKLDSHLYRALSQISKLEKHVDSQDKTIAQMEKSIKEQDKIISMLSNSLKKLQANHNKAATNIKADMNDVRSLANRKQKR
jgi:uncharacterized coiled-coil protein SlyX